jgi:serine/threonine protein kinase
MDVRSLEQIGPYRVARYVDEGAFAWVFEVVDPKFEGRRLALKMLMPEAAAGEEFRRFESEARLLAGIDHPNIVTIFDFGKEENYGNFYYTMTFVAGETLRQRLARGPLSVEEACKICIEILDGLATLHEQRIVHRDIKPANLLLGHDGRSRLSDLGIARVETERSKTRTGTAVGTALYMSPEQARGRPVDTRSDLFSVGLTLYEALTGNVVYDHVDSVDSTSGMDVLIYIGGLDQQ